MSDVALRAFFARDVFYGNSSSPVALHSARCTAEAHSTTVFALRNGKLSRLGGG